MSAKKNVALFMPVMVLCFLMTTLDASQIDDTCFEVIDSLLPCLPFLEAMHATPSTDCCAGATDLFHMTYISLHLIPRNVCQCIKASSTKFGFRIKSERSEQLPQLCSISLSFSLDPKIDCNS